MASTAAVTRAPSKDLLYEFTNPVAADRALATAVSEVTAETLKRVLLPKLCVELGFIIPAKVNIPESTPRRKAGFPGLTLKNVIEESFQVLCSFGQTIGPQVCFNIEPSEMDRRRNGDRWNHAEARAKIELACQKINREHTSDFNTQAAGVGVPPAPPRPAGQAAPAQPAAPPPADPVPPAPAPLKAQEGNFRCPVEGKRWTPGVRIGLKSGMLALALGRFDTQEFTGLQMRNLLAEVAGEKKPTSGMYGAFKALMAEKLFSVVKQEPSAPGSLRVEYTVTLSAEGRKRALELVTEGEEGTEFTPLISHRPESPKGGKNGGDIPDGFQDVFAKRRELEGIDAKKAELQEALDALDERRDILRREINAEVQKLAV